jgi:copper transport protein
MRLAPLVIAASLLAPAAAQAHAVLERTSPSQGADLGHQPDHVAFFFDESVEASFGAVRVFNRDGEQVETGAVYRPGGESDGVAVRLESDLPNGTYTATYRVISADSHPVSGGFVFSIGTPSAAGGTSVAQVLDDDSTGRVTATAFWADRWVGYGAMGIAIGALMFLLYAWRPALSRTAGAGGAWIEASRSFAARFRTVLGAAIVAGLVTSLVAIPLQGATAGGTTFWAALDEGVLREVAGTRFGTEMLIRAAAWIGLAAVLVLAATRGRMPALRPAQLGATGTALNRTAGPVWMIAAAIPVALLLISPALAGHAATQSPSGLLFPADVVHVTAMSAWFGGLCVLVFTLPVATGALDPPDRSRLLLAALTRFSTIALVSVIALAASGTVQAVVEVGSVPALVTTGFGRLVVAKVLLLATLIGLGASNRQRLIPALRRIVDAAHSPGRIGMALRRNLRLEVALVAAVLALTAVLVSYAPVGESSAGPVSGRTRLGPAELEYVIDPARVGGNQLHLYLFDAQDGSQYTAAKEVELDLTQPDHDIGPLEVDLRRAGPGHYVAPAAQFGVSGDWMATVAMRTSRFNEDEAKIEVPIK